MTIGRAGKAVIWARGCQAPCSSPCAGQGRGKQALQGSPPPGSPAPVTQSLPDLDPVRTLPARARVPKLRRARSEPGWRCMAQIMQAWPGPGTVPGRYRSPTGLNQGERRDALGPAAPPGVSYPLSYPESTPRREHPQSPPGAPSASIPQHATRRELAAPPLLGSDPALPPAEKRQGEAATARAGEPAMPCSAAPPACQRARARLPIKAREVGANWRPVPRYYLRLPSCLFPRLPRPRVGTPQGLRASSVPFLSRRALLILVDFTASIHACTSIALGSDDGVTRRPIAAPEPPSEAESFAAQVAEGDVALVPLVALPPRPARPCRLSSHSLPFSVGDGQIEGGRYFKSRSTRAVGILAQTVGCGQTVAIPGPTGPAVRPVGSESLAPMLVCRRPGGCDLCWYIISKLNAL